MVEPKHGFTKSGKPVYEKAMNHLKQETAYQRFNKSFAVKVTSAVGSMTCAYVFAFLALLSLPAVLSAFSAFAGDFPKWLIKASVIALVAWVAQTFLQLVLLSVIMVGQNVQQLASDARASKTFEDAEVILDRLNCQTQGGLTEVLDAVHALSEKIAAGMTAGQPSGPTGREAPETSDGRSPSATTSPRVPD
jgi:hypothetical protein